MEKDVRLAKSQNTTEILAQFWHFFIGSMKMFSIFTFKYVWVAKVQNSYNLWKQMSLMVICCVFYVGDVTCMFENILVFVWNFATRL